MPDHNTKRLEDCIEPLQKVFRSLSWTEILLWFNEKDIEYHHMVDIEMYIYYIKHNLNS